MNRVLVCGGRDFHDRKWLFDFMDGMDERGLVSVVISGAAAGADTLASEWATARGKTLVEFPADWKRHGRSAGPRRNRKMLVDGKPDLVVAFPGGKGTAHMIKISQDAGIYVFDLSRPLHILQDIAHRLARHVPKSFA